MNKEQILGVVRHGLTVVGGFLVAKGTLSEQALIELVGGLVSIIGFAWSFFSKR